MRNSYFRVPHNKERAGKGIARGIRKKKGMKAWWGDVRHCLVIELSLLDKDSSCSYQFRRNGKISFKFNNYFERKGQKAAPSAHDLQGALVRACRALHRMYGTASGHPRPSTEPNVLKEPFCFTEIMAQAIFQH